MNEITINAAVRTQQGSKAAGRLRRTGLIPGVLKRVSGEVTLIETDAHAYYMTMRNVRETRPVITLSLGDVTITAKLLEVQHDVISGEPTHLDFGEIAK